MADAVTAEQFFLGLLAGTTKDTGVLFWSPAGKSEQAFIKNGRLVVPSAVKKKLIDWYFHVCPVRLAKLPSRFAQRPKNERTSSSPRPNEKEVDWLAALWLDIDLPSPARKKSNLPPTAEEIEYIVAETCPPPTVIVNSGWGLHFYWFLEKPIDLTLENNRAYAKAISFTFHEQVKSTFQANGYELDSVFDLARVMRVPYTQNFKVKEEPRRAAIQSAALSCVYPITALVDVDALLTVPHTMVSQTPLPVVGFKPQEISSEVMALLLGNELFRATWEKKRALGETENKNVTPLNDTSPSAYEFSLISQAIRMGVTRPELLFSLCLNWRARHKIDDKTFSSGALREDYYHRSIERAQSTIHMLNKDLSFEDDPLKILGAVSQLVGVEIKRVVREIGDEKGAQYVLLTEHGRINIGSASSLLSMMTVRTSLFDTLGLLMEKHKVAVWDGVALGLRQIAEDVVIAQDPVEFAKEIILDYLVSINEKLGEITDDRFAESLKSEPLLKDEIVYIRLESLILAVEHRHLRLPWVGYFGRALEDMGWASAQSRFGKRVLRVWSISYVDFRRLLE